MTEANVIERAKAGDQAAFTEMYRKHSNRVRYICLKVIHDADASEDLTQETFLRAFTKLHTFQGEATFSTWIYRIAFNTALMELRRRRDPEVSLDEPRISEDGDVDLREHELLAVRDGHLEMTPERFAIEDAVNQLSPANRMVWEMKDLEGIEVKEIARVFQRPIGSVKSTISRARRELRFRLTPKLRKRKGGAH